VKKLWIIARKDIKESFRSRSTYIYVGVLLALTFTYLSTFNSIVSNLNTQNASAGEIYRASQIFINSLAYMLPIMYSILVCTIFAQYAVVVDKARKNIESLMATSTSLKEIWMGKTLAVALPSSIIGISVAIAGYCIVNALAVSRQVGGFIVPDIFSIITAVIIVPILIFAIVSIVVYIQLVISNPRVANIVFTAMFLLLYFGTTILSVFGKGINFGLIYLGVIVICAIISTILSRSLTKERVILSSR
jgi:ABC-type Na+ efflux pump permease subunit